MWEELKAAGIPPGHLAKLRVAITALQPPAADLSRRQLASGGGATLKLQDESTSAQVSARGGALSLAVGSDDEVSCKSGQICLGGGRVNVTDSLVVGGSASAPGHFQVKPADGNGHMGIELKSADGKQALLDLGEASSDYHARFETSSEASGLAVRVQAGAPITFSAQGAPSVRISGAGHVGIGTSSPAEALDVVGNAKVSGSASVGTDLVVGASGAPSHVSIGGLLEVIERDTTGVHTGMDFAVEIKGLHSYVEITAFMTHCGGGCHTAFQHRVFSFNSYAAMIELTNDAHSNRGSGPYPSTQDLSTGGDWHFERVHTGHNSHDWTSNLLRITHVGSSTTFGCVQRDAPGLSPWPCSYIALRRGRCGREE